MIVSSRPLAFPSRSIIDLDNSLRAPSVSGPPYPWSARGALSSNTRGISWNRARYLTLVLSLALVLSLTLSLVELTLGSLARGGFLSRGSLPQPRMVGTQIWCPRRAQSQGLARGRRYGTSRRTCRSPPFCSRHHVGSKGRQASTRGGVAFGVFARREGFDM